MMTESMKTLEISTLRTIISIGKKLSGEESCLLKEAGSRLYLDITPLLHYPQARKLLPSILSGVDELISQVVQERHHT